jgi:hypothetical protein
VRVTCDSSGIAALASDLKTMTRRAPIELKKVVRKNTIEGNRLAKGYASQQHTMNSNYDIHYPKSFTWEVGSFYGYGGGNITGTYGPDSARRQGSMSFEHGSRNQPPHLDLARSADVIAWQFGPNVLYAAQNLFWPGA